MQTIPIKLKRSGWMNVGWTLRAKTGKKQRTKFEEELNTNLG